MDLEKIALEFARNGHVENVHFNDIHDNQNVFVGSEGIKTERIKTKSTEEVENAIRQLMNEKGADGKYVMQDQDQWYGVKQVLTQHSGFPVKPADFAKVLHDLELDDLRVRYDYESIRKVHPQNLPANVNLWKSFEHVGDDYSMKQVRVALTLMGLLGIT